MWIKWKCLSAVSEWILTAAKKTVPLTQLSVQILFQVEIQMKMVVFPPCPYIVNMVRSRLFVTLNLYWKWTSCITNIQNSCLRITTAVSCVLFVFYHSALHFKICFSWPKTSYTCSGRAQVKSGILSAYSIRSSCFYLLFLVIN